jgi:hypothetical protein
MPADVAHVEREDPRPVYDEMRAGDGAASASFNPLGSSQSQPIGVVVSQLLSPRVAGLSHVESENQFPHSLAQHLLADPEHGLERSNQAAARLCGAGPAGVSLVETDLVAETRVPPQAERQRGTPPVTAGTEMSDLRLAFRSLIEQVRLVLRDGRRLIRRLIAACDTSKPFMRLPMTSSPAPLASVPLVVLRATTEREQIELRDLVQRLTAGGYQIAGHGPQWVVYTEITERRTSVVGRWPQEGGGITAMREWVGHGALRHCRSDDRPH